MPKLPSFKARDIEKILKREGFMIQRQTGSHRIFYNSNTDKIAVVPVHTKDIPKGTVKSIIKQSGLPEEAFLKKIK